MSKEPSFSYGEKMPGNRVFMKNQRWILYFSTFLTLFLMLIVAVGPGFSSSSFDGARGNTEIAVVPSILAGDYSGCELSADEESVDSKLSEDSCNRYNELSEHLFGLPVYRYPYESLPSQLEAEGKKSIKLFVYGSLMDLKSAKQTLSENTLKTRKLAKAYGVKVIYNRYVPYIFVPHWGKPALPCVIAMLNTIVTGHSEEIALGALLDIPLNEIPVLLSREVGYDLRPVVVEDWVEPLREKITNTSAVHGRGNLRIAYILSAPTPSRYTSTHLLPREGYYQRVMEAARSSGYWFFQQWLNNTYLADGVTTVGDYEFYKERVVKEFDRPECVICVSLQCELIPQESPANSTEE